MLDDGIDSTPNTPDSSIQERVADKPVNSVVKGAAYGIKLPRDPAAGKIHPSARRTVSTAPKRMATKFRGFK